MGDSQMRPEDDALLPGVRFALDLDAFLPLLNHELREHGEEVQASRGTIVEVQYKAGRTCLVLYRLRFSNPSTGRASRRLLSAQVQQPDQEPARLAPEVIERFDTYRKKFLMSPELHLKGTGITVRPFPLDMVMPWLVDTVDSSTIKRHMNEAWRARKLNVRSVSHRILGYTPSARATFVYTVDAENRETGAREVQTVVGKTHFSKAPDRLFTDAWALWRAAGGRVGLAEPLGYIAPLRMTLQQQVCGRRLSEFAGTEQFIPLVRLTAESIATLHTLRFPLTTRRSSAKETDVVRRWANVLSAISPQLGTKTEHLRERLSKALCEHSVQSGPVHGDFHPANVLSDGHDITIVDLDEMAYGDPLIDVGRFLASLRVSAMRVHGDPAGLTQAEEVFLDEYLSRVPGTRLRARVFEATSLLIAAATPFRLQRPGWEDAAAQMVDEAERVLCMVENAPSVRPAVAVEGPPMPLKDRVSWASDTMYAQARLHPHMMEGYGVTITSCRAHTVHSSEDGYRIKYRLSGRHEQERWRSSFVGLISQKPTSSGGGKRLAALRSALNGSHDAPVLPRPAAHLRELSMLVVEALSGYPLRDLVGSSDAPAAYRKLGRALATIQLADAGIQKTHSPEDEVRSLSQHVARLSELRPDLGPPAASTLREIERRCRNGDQRYVPALRAVPLERTLWQEGRIAIGEVRDVVMAPTMIDIADVLARLSHIGIRTGQTAEVEELKMHLLDGYLSRGGSDVDHLAAYEAGAYLRLASLVAEKSPKSGRPRRLLLRAEARLRLN